MKINEKVIMKSQASETIKLEYVTRETTLADQMHVPAVISDNFLLQWQTRVKCPNHKKRTGG
jgi:hypothetical protein